MVFKVFSLDRVQQRCLVPWNAFLSGLWSKTSISLLVEASKIFSQDRVNLHHLHLQLVFMVLQMGLVKGFFALFPERKKFEDRSALGVGTECGLYFIHPGSSCGLVGGGGASRQLQADRWDSSVQFFGKVVELLLLCNDRCRV